VIVFVITRGIFPKERHLGPQNGSDSLGPKKLPKIVNCATIKEIEKNERNNGEGSSGIGGWPPMSTQIKWAPWDHHTVYFRFRHRRTI